MESVYLDLPVAFQRQTMEIWERMHPQLRHCFLASEMTLVTSAVARGIDSVILAKLNNPETEYDDIDTYEIIRKCSEADDLFHFHLAIGAVNEATAYRIMYYAMEDDAPAYAKKFLNDVMDLNKMDPDIYKETGILKTEFNEKSLTLVMCKLRGYILEEFLSEIDWATTLGDLTYEGVNGMVATVDTTRGIIKADLYPSATVQ